MDRGHPGHLLWAGHPGAAGLDIAHQLQDPPDSISYPPKVLFSPSIEGYVNLFTTRTRLAPEQLAALPPPANFAEEIVRNRNMVIVGKSKFGERFMNSVIIGFGSTFLSVFLGTLAAYAFSRFKIPLKEDLLFFILSTRMMPPIAVAIPIFLMYRNLGLSDTYLGMILLYTGVNISLAVWLLKGFIDEIPREYEEAALIDGYTRIQAFIKVVLPQAAAGIASTAIFCLIFAWNEYAFAVLLSSGNAQTAPPSFPPLSALAVWTGPPWRPVPPCSVAGDDFHHPAAQASAARHHIRSGAQMTRFFSGLIRFRRGAWEMVATILIALGVFMLMQPFALWAYTYSFVVTLAGTVMFLIVSHFPN
jgi:multiple sugar transport system permease protein